MAMQQYQTVRFKLNGRDVERTVDVRASLTDMLRNDYRMTSVKKGCDIARFAIESDLGEVQIASQNCNTSKTDRDNWTLKFYPKEEDIGKRTYTIYAVAADGTRYEYALTLKLEVQ
mgnify:CR=1 FL=1